MRYLILMSLLISACGNNEYKQQSTQKINYPNGIVLDISKVIDRCKLDCFNRVDENNCIDDCYNNFMSIFHYSVNQ